MSNPAGVICSDLRDVRSSCKIFNNTTEHVLYLTNRTCQFSPVIQFALSRRPLVSLEFIAFNIILLLILRRGNLLYFIARNY